MGIQHPTKYEPCGDALFLPKKLMLFGYLFTKEAEYIFINKIKFLSFYTCRYVCM